MPLEKDLLSLPPSQWIVRRAVIFDWYDGPRHGICALSQPSAEFAFELLDERQNPDDLDDRLFRVKELCSGSVDKALACLTPLGLPETAVWVPVWKFPSEHERKAAEQTIEQILSRGRSTPVVIATRDMEHFLGCWSIEQHALNGQSDWFAALGISQGQLTGRP